MKFLGEWLGLSLGLIIFFHIVFFIASLFGVAFDTEDMLSWEVFLIITGISIFTGLITAFIQANEPSCPFELTEREATLWLNTVERLIEYRDRIINSNHPDNNFILEHLNNKKIGEIAGYIAQKMALTENDGKSHSIMFGDENLCISVLTLLESKDGAAKWIEDNHGGYVSMLNRLAPMAESMDAKALCQITANKKTKYASKPLMHIGLFPLHGDVFRTHPIVPTDLLSKNDHDKAGNSFIEIYEGMRIDKDQDDVLIIKVN